MFSKIEYALRAVSESRVLRNITTRAYSDVIGTARLSLVLVVLVTDLVLFT